MMTRPSIRNALLAARDESVVLSTLDEVGRTPLPWTALPRREESDAKG